eukprot:COSAG06_NODE_596_length_13926_cov_33.841614_11_plen_67_part_00
MRPYFVIGTPFARGKIGISGRTPMGISFALPEDGEDGSVVALCRGATDCGTQGEHTGEQASCFDAM